MNTETKQLSDIEVIGENSVSLSTEDFINSLGVDRSTGLSDSQAKALLEQNGENVLAAGKQNTWYKILFHQFKDLLNIMLSIIAIVDFAFLPFLHEDQRLDHLIQGIVILVIVICNIALATFQEVKANNALESLQKTSSPTAKVLRDGKQQIVLTKDLVIGDIVLLEEGMIVPADIRLFEANSLKIEEAALTGESLPSEKDVSVVIDSTTAIGDRANFAFASTIVTYGSGIGIVSATGMNTEIGKIAKLLSSSGNKEDLPPLKKKINKLTKTLTWFAFILLAVNAILNISFYFGNWYPSYWGITGVAGVDNQSAPWGFWIELDTIISAIALAISLIPVALPVSTTVVLSISVAKLAKKHALCKQLAIVEAIGNATVICSDKTGTLTLNKMTVTDICDYDDIISKKNKNPLEVKENFARYKHLISIGMFCNNAEINESENTSIGDPTEAALLYLGSKTDLDVSKTRNKYKRVFEQPFDSDRKLMTTVYKTKAGYTSFTKGAAESIVNLCTEIQTRDGVRPMTDEDRKVIKAYLDLLSSNALRVLGMSSRNFTDEPQKDSNYENNMIFKGLVGMIDPPRPEVFDAVKVCHEAGVKVAMITGDHQITALAIAKNLGIVEEDDNTTLTGVEIDAMSEEELKYAVNKCCVYARVSPDNKLRIVKAFKQNKEIVGMTGDGTNDAPALKEADIGIAMGIAGTDVAKGAAGILLLDDNFTTIKSAINDGRKITRNIKNVVSFILSTNLATGIFVLFFTFIFGMNAITISQRLLLDLVTDTLPCIFIGLNPNDFGIMKKRANKNDKMFDKEMLLGILINTFAVLLPVALTFIIAYFGVGIREANSINILCFITLSISRILLSLTYVSRSASIFTKTGHVYANLWIGVCVSIILLFCLVFTPGLNIVVVGTHPAREFKEQTTIWAAVLLLPLFPVAVNEVKKVITLKCFN